MHTHNQLRLEAVHLLQQKARFRLRQRFAARPTARIAAGPGFPIDAGVATPIGGRKIAIQIHSIGIYTVRWLGEEAVWVQHRNKTPVNLPSTLALTCHGQWNPVKNQCARRHFIAVNAAQNQNPQGRLFWHHVAP